MRRIERAEIAKDSRLNCSDFEIPTALHPDHQNTLQSVSHYKNLKLLICFIFAGFVIVAVYSTYSNLLQKTSFKEGYMQYFPNRVHNFEKASFAVNGEGLIISNTTEGNEDVKLRVYKSATSVLLTAFRPGKLIKLSYHPNQIIKGENDSNITSLAPTKYVLNNFVFLDSQIYSSTSTQSIKYNSEVHIKMEYILCILPLCNHSSDITQIKGKITWNDPENKKNTLKFIIDDITLNYDQSQQNLKIYLILFPCVFVLLISSAISFMTLPSEQSNVSFNINKVFIITTCRPNYI